jgi:serine/threonine-protein kinase HipA
MRELKLDYNATEQMFRRMVFNVLARNCDDHTKNFSFLLTQHGQWELAPAYDVCHAYRPGSEWVSQHALSINNKRKNITKEDLISISDSFNLKKAKRIILEINDSIQNWKKYAKEVAVKPALRDAIQKTLLNIN